MGELSQGHDQARAQYDKLVAGDKVIHALRNQIDSLTLLGDKVTTEDLVQAASRCVAAGAEPENIAALLSSAPAEGQALATWAEQQDEKLQQIEKLMDAELGKAKFQLGLSALHVIAGSAIGQRRDAAAAAMPQNALGGGAAPEAAAAAPETETPAPVQAAPSPSGLDNTLMGGSPDA